MGYRIEYGPGERIWQRVGLSVLTVVCFVIFLRLVGACWPGGREVLADWLLPERTEEAVAVFSREVSRGHGLGEGIAAFVGKLFGQG